VHTIWRFGNQQPVETGGQPEACDVISAVTEFMVIGLQLRLVGNPRRVMVVLALACSSIMPRAKTASNKRNGNSVLSKGPFYQVVKGTTTTYSVKDRSIK
jgi:hypothetical protein